MNGRVHELWRACVQKHTKDPMNWQTVADEFALLIVGECLLALEPDLYSEEIDYEFEQRFYRRCREKIAKHFGVE